MAAIFTGAIALEPGGPSPRFGRRGTMPVYPQLDALDTLDFSERTLWSDGQVGIEPRRRLIGEARRIEGVPDAAYDALLGSHVLEHLANPLGALAEWQRVVRPGGHILLVMPHREGTFDHRRPVTSVEHMRADAQRETSEDDMTHLEEILALHDLARDPGAPSREVFEQRCRENASSRGMHHHVFDSRAVVEMCRAASLEVLALRPKRPFDIFCLCRVSTADGENDGRATGRRERDGYGVLSDSELSEILSKSPFVSDQSTA